MKNILKTALFLALLFCGYNSYSQLEFSKWYFGLQAGLDFSTTPPTVLTNGLINTSEGCATVCDAAGNLLFYTDGTLVRDQLHSVMANSSGMLGNSTTTQSGMIVKQPGNNSLYYVFTLAYIGGSSNYSIVDMSLAAGLGSVTVKNATLHPTSCEKQVAVRHCNGKDAWIITHDMGSNQFRTWLLTSTGLNPSPVISSVGEAPGGNGSCAAGHLKISPDGKKLAMATYSNSTPASAGAGGFHLFDFDPSSGIVSNSLTLNTSAFAYGVEFSPNGSKLYGVTSPMSFSVPATFYQWNVCVGSPSAIIASQYSVSYNNIGFGSLQRAIDGKIYLSAVTSPPSQSLSVIHNPNNSGAAMGFTLFGQSTAPKNCAQGLPNFINFYTKPTPLPISNTIACQTASFSTPTIPSASSGCSGPAYTANGYLWDFGEPGSGASNTSTMSNPAHTYTALGTYTVSLILYSNCTNDTLKKVITLTTPGPTPAVTGPTEICKGEKNTYTVSGGTSYKWFNNATTSTLSLAPTTTTVYSVAATTNGCTLSKTFTVTVNPCTGIDAVQSNGIWRVFPNPFSDYLLVESSLDSKLMLFDLNGSLVLESDLNSGQTKINTAHLKAGVYTLKAVSTDGTWQARFVKME